MAEDVVQAAFLRLWNHAGRWEGRARFSTWFYRVVHNLCIDQMRRQHRDFDPLADTLPDPAPGPHEQLEQEQRGLDVQQALARLPERQRAAIVLSHYQECTQGEAASILGISEGALESLLSRGRAALRLLLRDQRH
jgi:RNA polymerase sigma-70 factor (ECF subfamily)